MTCEIVVREISLSAFLPFADEETDGLDLSLELSPYELGIEENGAEICL
jgi:hypothetical protein